MQHQDENRPTTPHPNIVLLMCDDLGYGDTGFNGNTVIATPHLDALRTQGARFTRFYAGGPVCSPTRGTCLTGRHYSRYGITHANVGHLPEQEFTLARMCRERGYATGHFGKWHLGTLERTWSGKPDRDPATHYAPPWERDYEHSFATEFAVPTWDPSRGFDPCTGARSDEPWPSPYYRDGVRVDRPLRGCDSALIVDAALGFVEEAVTSGRPFLSTVWFHAPHTPVEAGPAYHARYAARHGDDAAHYYGCISAMDEQVGRLLARLDQLGVGDDTIVFFCSDNGPEGGYGKPQHHRCHGDTAGLRGRKRSLFDGGIAVPALVRWPGLVTAGATVEAPCSTLDYLPTLAAALDVHLPADRPYDGIDIRDLLAGRRRRRESPIPYRFVDGRQAMFGAPTLALIDDEWKLLTNLVDDDEDQLFRLDEDRGETTDLRRDHPVRADAMHQHLRAFIDSCRRSHHGLDYPEPFIPTAAFQEPIGWPWP